MALWVFGYGSLLWNPGFEVAESVIASLPGYARSFCMRSIHHRGTLEDPGLVLALDEQPQTACSGMALRVMDGQEDETLAYLRERELVSAAYLEKMLDVTLADGRIVTAVVYVIDENHEQYCGGLPLEEQAQIIAMAVGGRGPNTEYLYNTADHLCAVGLEDADLNWLHTRVKALAG
ncbi:gamma-glutamylcyclotransferase [Sulfitobacter sp. M57]|uniref:gamma-glutamylcyclotransferase n=1 Tax=unclassified Sulfitobacter TaxID=196795 RepID=UPI0023E1F92F|nr:MULTISPECIES: gamma-glutamylcyclotransferase [unclassified Sulfitobacter]MDF3415583.1 gamma-glutamylcyclotransferase [Sulfitobacter sp. KE5]MDF3423063.1 gamma-glutamylcyclotransferase [Sulfitobacter sp. KE43]MDF3434129.1 gamma-glutamylcyclotransferase [Sulfitobacter sp. KE42]MDF3459838.1 gamma-glutamylcyclotransferase [Sulfitobacter sp. S74]MDF3463667.1 gamma-glutamylcyclotransferase [Sulfitobacter sp. Ks18]